MKPATEEFLYFLLWTADTLLRPSWRNVTGGDSFESWAYRNGLLRRLGELERLKLIETRTPKGDTERLVRLTATGRERALAGVDPVPEWERSWDGRWRLVLFDVPQSAAKQRVRLRRVLRERRFGFLQNSVWISPDSLDEFRRRMAGARSDVEGLAFFEGRPGGGESDQDLVLGAWDFPEILSRYEAWSRVADAAPKNRPTSAAAADIVRRWAAHERAAWAHIVARDPFLPAPLLPAGYPGRTAWLRRARLLTSLGQLLVGA